VAIQSERAAQLGRSSEYRLIIDRNFMKIGAISLLILAGAAENGL
jgi:hypothetical protein